MDGWIDDKDGNELLGWMVETSNSRAERRIPATAVHSKICT